MTVLLRTDAEKPSSPPTKEEAPFQKTNKKKLCGL
jgi:hypothetical protein